MFGAALVVINRPLAASTGAAIIGIQAERGAPRSCRKLSAAAALRMTPAKAEPGYSSAARGARSACRLKAAQASGPVCCQACMSTMARLMFIPYKKLLANVEANTSRRVSAEVIVFPPAARPNYEVRSRHAPAPQALVRPGCTRIPAANTRLWRWTMVQSGQAGPERSLRVRWLGESPHRWDGPAG